MSELVRCVFYVKTPLVDGFGYDAVPAQYGPEGSGPLVTPYPPVIGDLISLQGPSRGTYRVVDRAWLHSSYGSVDWPVRQERPTRGPLLDIIVEPATGPFLDEVVISR